jgi:hypothetical protein
MKREHLHARFQTFLLIVSGLVLAGCRKAPLIPAANTSTSPALTAASAPDSGLRFVYPFSLIPGGVASDTEFQAARLADPLLEEHYADVGFLRPAILSADRWLYASYRRGASIFWTASRVHVRAGEVVLEDRTGNLIRGRCGNRLSDSPRQPVSQFQPPDSAFDSPEISFPDPPLLPASLEDRSAPSFPPSLPEPALPPVPATANAPLPPTLVRVSAPSGGLFPPVANPLGTGIPLYAPAPLAPVPEPDTASLMLLGGVLVLIGCAKNRKRAGSNNLAALALLAITGVSFAKADTIEFLGAPTGVNDGKYYVTPYEISIDGVDQLVTCYDTFDDVTVGETWDADLLTLQQAAASGFFSSDPDALAGYERIAWLDAQSYQNAAEQIGLQYAIWSVFGTAPTTAESLTYEADADAAAGSGYQGFSFSEVRFVEQVDGVPGQQGTAQAFVYWDPPPATSSAPEPGTWALILSALLFGAAYSVRSRPPAAAGAPGQGIEKNSEKSSREITEGDY